MTRHTAGLYKSGGGPDATPMMLTRCIESAKLRYKEVAELLRAALAEKEADGMES